MVFGLMVWPSGRVVALGADLGLPLDPYPGVSFFRAQSHSSSVAIAKERHSKSGPRESIAIGDLPPRDELMRLICQSGDIIVGDILNNRAAILGPSHSIGEPQWPASSWSHRPIVGAYISDSSRIVSFEWSNFGINELADLMRGNFSLISRVQMNEQLAVFSEVDISPNNADIRPQFYLRGIFGIGDKSLGRSPQFVRKDRQNNSPYRQNASGDGEFPRSIDKLTFVVSMLAGLFLVGIGANYLYERRLVLGGALFVAGIAVYAFATLTPVQWAVAW